MGKVGEILRAGQIKVAWIDELRGLPRAQQRSTYLKSYHAAVLAELALLGRSEWHHFAKLDQAEDVMVAGIDGASRSITGVVYSLTKRRVVQALLRAKARGVDVYLLADKVNARMAASADLFNEMIVNEIPIHFVDDSSTVHGKLKVCFILFVVTLLTMLSSVLVLRWSRLVSTGSANVSVKAMGSSEVDGLPVRPTSCEDMKWSPDSRAIALQLKFDIRVVPGTLQRDRLTRHALFSRSTHGPATVAADKAVKSKPAKTKRRSVKAVKTVMAVKRIKTVKPKLAVTCSSNG
ncbi:unnamed protein product [Phytophthora lilii]|uniref:Unnamed protein product n=1 Tax=Phytophthora lilii TaxID=2077276 RepID=A0A9W6TZT6_9STRA|nr:unnamed protein product [Phytophthora lilii]